MLVSSLFLACGEESMIDVGTIPEDIPGRKPELKLLSFDEKSETNENLHTQWESVNEIRLNNNEPVIVPWKAGGGSSLDIPQSLVEDIKKEDGWIVLSHTMIKINNEPNYIIFYNRQRGQLKVFYYNPTNIINKSLIWVLEANSPTSVLPSNELVQGIINTTNKYATTSNILNNSIANFGQLVQGWNMFTIELPYGQTNNNPVINIRAYNDHSSVIELGGKFSGDVTINIPQSSPSFLSSLLSIITEIPKFTKPENWIDKIYNVKDGVSALGKIGSSSLFTSKAGDMIVKGTTSGDITLTGKEFANYGGAVTSLIGIDLKKINNNKQLGLWTLKEIPTFSYNKYSLCGLSRDRKYSYPLELRYSGNNTNNMITINPEIADQIKSYSVGVNNFFMKTYPYKYESNLVADKVYDLTEILNGNITVFGSEPYIEPGASTRPYDFIMVAEHVISSDLYANITVNFEYKDGSKFNSTRNYKIKTAPYDNWSDAENKASRYNRVEYITVW